MLNRLLAVLVLYGMPLQESPCFQSLRDNVQGDLPLLVYDNSRLSGGPAAYPGELTYQHDPANGGVAAAYNAGLEEARSRGAEWLLLLDQDTTLTLEFLAELRRCVETVPSAVDAIIPRLIESGATHSPHLLPRLSHRPAAESWAGVLPVEVSAFNSGAALRVSAVNRFPDRYWLDFLDHAVFHQLQAQGGKVWLMHARLQHRLSTQKLGTDASLGRYRNVLQAERDFYHEYGSPESRFFYHLRRLKQTAGHLLKVRDKRFALLSARAALGLLPPTPARDADLPALSTR